MLRGKVHLVTLLFELVKELLIRLVIKFLNRLVLRLVDKHLIESFSGVLSGEVAEVENGYLMGSGRGIIRIKTE